ncbi:MAG: hypothetical protein LBR45_00620, partial [Bacteroidales bacterium]|nr:hypothetical protein [Bacteroidales bacterium]
MIFLLLLISGIISVLLILAGLIVLLIPSKKKNNSALTLSQALGMETTVVQPAVPQQPYQAIDRPRIVNPTPSPAPVSIPVAEPTTPQQPHRVNAQQIQQLITNHEMLLTLIDGVQKIGNSRKDEQIVKTAKSLVQTVENFAGEQSWLAIKPYIETLHPDFFKKLNNASSEALSDFEIRTCLLSIFDMSSKEIAQITNRSVRTIETAVYKIRKKLS